MKIIHHAWLLGGLIFYLLFMSLDTTYPQQMPPRGYLFLEVNDTEGRKIAEAAVSLSGVDGKEILSVKTNADGIVKADFWFWQAADHHLGLQISKSGFLPYEQVIFFYAPLNDVGHNLLGRVEELSNSPEELKNALATPAKIVLRRTPLTAAERRVIELEDRKRQLLMAAKRGDPASLRKFLQAGAKADTTDAKGVPAIAWAALAGDTEVIKILLDTGAEVRRKRGPGHQALLIYLHEGVFRSRSE